MAFLTIDQGGHGTRVALFDRIGRMLRSEYRPVSTSRPGPGRVEQDPAEILESVRLAMGRLIQEPVEAAGLATQRASVVCWDRSSGRPLTPVLSWQDRRSPPFPDPGRPSAEMIRIRTGLMQSPHYGAGKLRWCLSRNQKVQEAHRDGKLACGPLAAFLLFSLVPDRPLLVDPANGGRTLLWHLAAGTWDGDLLDAAGVPREVLPEPAPTMHRFGSLETGAGPVPLTVLNGDQSCVPFLAGRPYEGTVYINMGTGAFLQKVALPGEPTPDRLLRSVILDAGPERTEVVEGTVNGAGAALSALGCMGTPGGWLETPEPPLFLNGVSGLGSPWWVADFPWCFVGDGEPAARRDAVLESILFLIRANLDRMIRPGETGRLVVTGGLSRSDPLCRRLADLCSMPVERPAVQEATSSGLAFLAAGMPDRWDGAGPPTVFNPQPGHPVAVRYRRWLAAMQEALQA